MVRILQHNGVRWCDQFLLVVATDPYSIVPEHASMFKGVDVYSRLLTCQAMQIRAGIAGVDAAVAAALAQNDLNMAQLKQQMQVLQAQKQAILQDDKLKKRSGK